MNDIFFQLVRNKIFLTVLSSWVIAQALKVIVGYFIQKKVDFRWFVGTGGMPSSHTAGASCLAGDVFGRHGFTEPLRTGSKVVFGNTGAYSIVKASMFNGINLPDRQQSVLHVEAV